MAIALFFVGHWTLSVFTQTFFLHRYGAHRVFTMSRGWERFFYLVTLGELLQNNHHRFGMSPNFAVRWFELDPTYQVMRAFAWLGIIDFGEHRQTTRYEAAAGG